jgi:uncharacterized protein with PIN domain
MKTIDDSRISEISAELKKLNNTLLEENRCPVCGTPLLNISRRG